MALREENPLPGCRGPRTRIAAEVGNRWSATARAQGWGLTKIRNSRTLIEAVKMGEHRLNSKSSSSDRTPEVAATASPWRVATRSSQSMAHPVWASIEQDKKETNREAWTPRTAATQDSPTPKSSMLLQHQNQNSKMMIPTLKTTSLTTSTTSRKN